MNGWNEGITNAIAYIEDNLTEDMDINDIAGKAFTSKKSFMYYADSQLVNISETAV